MYDFLKRLFYPLHTLSLLWKEVKAEENSQTFLEDVWEMNNWLSIIH